jgi:hypothetical protein
MVRPLVWTRALQLPAALAETRMALRKGRLLVALQPLHVGSIWLSRVQPMDRLRLLSPRISDAVLQ